MVILHFWKNNHFFLIFCQINNRTFDLSPYDNLNGWVVDYLSIAIVTFTTQHFLMSDCYNKCSFYTLTLQQSLVLPTHKYLRHCCYKQQFSNHHQWGCLGYAFCQLLCFHQCQKKGEVMKLTKRRMHRMGKRKKTKKSFYS